MIIRRKQKLKCLESDYIKYNALLRFLMTDDSKEKLQKEIGSEWFDEIINSIASETKYLYDVIPKRWHEV